MLNNRQSTNDLQKKQEYAQTLKQQMEQKQARKLEEKNFNMAFDQKLLQDIMYDVRKSSDGITDEKQQILQQSIEAMHQQYPNKYNYEQNSGNQMKPNNRYNQSQSNFLRSSKNNSQNQLIHMSTPNLLINNHQMQQQQQQIQQQQQQQLQQQQINSSQYSQFGQPQQIYSQIQPIQQQQQIQQQQLFQQPQQYQMDPQHQQIFQNQPGVNMYNYNQFNDKNKFNEQKVDQLDQVIENDIKFHEKQKKQSKFIEYQEELKQQIELNELKKKTMREKKKLDDELDEIRLQKEKQEIDLRIKMENQMQKIEHRNLQETDIEKDKKQKFIQQQEVDNENLKLMMLRKEMKKEPQIRVRTPIEDAINQVKMQEQDERSRIDSRLVNQIPLEIEQKIQKVMDVELQRIKNELNFQQNILHEQVHNLKFQLSDTELERHQAIQEINFLKNELQKNQIVQQIRQNELYEALIQKNGKPDIHFERTRPINNDLTLDFRFPRRPVPYYNQNDPYLKNDPQNAAKDIHDILISKTEMIPASYSYDHINIKNKIDNLGNSDQEFFNYSRNVRQFGYKGAIDVKNKIDLPEDINNLQNLQNTQYNYDEDHDYIPQLYSKNKKKLKQLNNINPKSELDKLDAMLFNVIGATDKQNLSHINSSPYSQNETNFPSHYKYKINGY